MIFFYVLWNFIKTWNKVLHHDSNNIPLLWNQIKINIKRQQKMLSHFVFINRKAIHFSLREIITDTIICWSSKFWENQNKYGNTGFCMLFLYIMLEVQVMYRVKKNYFLCWNTLFHNKENFLSFVEVISNIYN